MGKHDDSIKKLFNSGMGGRLIAKELGINLGTVSKRMKVLGLNSGKKNQNNISCDRLGIKFCVDKNKLRFAAEHYARYWFMLCGFEMLNPDYFDTQPYDFKVKIDGWKKIQIKTSCSSIRSSSRFMFRLYKSRYRDGGKSTKELYKKDEIDYFFLHALSGDSWLVPFDKVEGQSTVVPETSFPNFKLDPPDINPILLD